jgi:hypothetical protein
MIVDPQIMDQIKTYAKNNPIHDQKKGSTIHDPWIGIGIFPKKIRSLRSENGIVDPDPDRLKIVDSDPWIMILPNTE